VVEVDLFRHQIHLQIIREDSPQQAQVAARLRIAFWPWDIPHPVEYDFNMDDALMEVRGLPSGHLFNDFELEEYINERLTDYEYARAKMPAEHPLFHKENEFQTLYRFYPDIDWLQVRVYFEGIDLKRAYKYKYYQSHFLFFPKI
jgi:hypothetical protein